MKYSFTKRNLLIYFLVLVISFIALRIISKHDKNENINIFNNAAYSIGKIIFYSKTKKPGILGQQGSSADVRYIFEVEDQKFETYYTARQFNIPDINQRPGDMFVVIFSKIDPRNNRMLFGYPIKDSADYTRYVLQFKTNPPELDNWGHKNK
jgi:hypothetical protein